MRATGTNTKSVATEFLVYILQTTVTSNILVVFPASVNDLNNTKNSFY